MNQKVLECVYAAVDEANLDRAGEPPIEKSPETPIFGTADALDSLGLINFIVAAEESVERAFGAQVVLGDDRALSAEPSPFRSIGALVEYVAEVLREEGVAVEEAHVPDDVR
jgi:acyl carrier protein